MPKKMKDNRSIGYSREMLTRCIKAVMSAQDAMLSAANITSATISFIDNFSLDIMGTRNVPTMQSRSLKINAP